jgi:hypothetical protein
MKMLAEYLENAIRFEKMAAEEKDAKLKADFEKQPPLIASSRKRERKSTASKYRPTRILRARAKLSDPSDAILLPI